MAKTEVMKEYFVGVGTGGIIVEARTAKEALEIATKKYGTSVRTSTIKVNHPEYQLTFEKDGCIETSPIYKKDEHRQAWINGMTKKGWKLVGEKKIGDYIPLKRSDVEK